MVPPGFDEPGAPTIEPAEVPDPLPTVSPAQPTYLPSCTPKTKGTISASAPNTFTT
jgi:hypothetical protein